ncbi:metal-dependent hydrolase [Halomonas eurihalina]|uniref:Metal-dependent hydrolase n=1 Tax=Halomonas eurihalina TaxID=42566 RepID=A0A5D9DC25_HALER|nr:metal-dependent hydrolase [Halomonas eurihalina]MDR5859116.1 metal-dependent hydrolase [Halomonas eurihalina]TZG41053.1 metal-dependent hydrolase [Halomonas eurihalina]
MDSVTQAALGAAIGGVVLGRHLGRRAVLFGAVLGTLPDLDVVIDYGDAVANVTQHRGFSHSLFVLAGLATALALLARRLTPLREIGLGRWLAFFGLCLMTHPLLDALTTYGTQLWWPLDAPPVAAPLVFIIDPLYSLPLLIGIGVALITGNGVRAPAWGLALSCAYLVASLGAKTLVEQRLAPVLAERGLGEAPRLVQPTPFNILLWRATIIDDGAYHEALVGVFDGGHPPSLETFSRGAELEPAALASAAGQRLDWFAGPYLRYEVMERNGQDILVATDLRLGFPGFHPFRYALASRQEAEWHPLATTRQLPEAGGDDRSAMRHLVGRILAPEPMLCTSRFVSREWIVEVPAECQQPGLNDKRAVERPPAERAGLG